MYIFIYIHNIDKSQQKLFLSHRASAINQPIEISLKMFGLRTRSLDVGLEMIRCVFGAPSKFTASTNQKLLMKINEEYFKFIH